MISKLFLVDMEVIYVMVIMAFWCMKKSKQESDGERIMGFGGGRAGFVCC